MTNKTEDRFYFGKPGQPERFAKPQFRSVKLFNGYLRIDVNQGSGWERYDTTHEESFDGLEDYERGWEKAYSRGLRWSGGSWRIPTNKFSRPGQPERFSSIMDEIASAEDAVYDGRDSAGVQIQELLAKMRRGVMTEEEKKYFLEVVREAKAYGMYSRPGSPDKFDASSLDRGNFAEASKSPMLGKLLSEKAMPDGGWRAVQVGSDTLVISFEDADLARDFGRRVASKGYSATSPVATTGRYWNVEVKNGK